MKRFVTFLLALVFFTGVAIAAPQAAVKFAPEETPFVKNTDNNVWVSKDRVGHIIIAGAIFGTFDGVVRAFNYFKRFGVKRVIIRINSPGGDLFDGMAVAQYLVMKEKQGYVVETHCDALAASAASLIMAAGSKGLRFMHTYSFFMVHELRVFKFFSTSSVSQSEKEAAALRKIQDNVDAFVASLTRLKKEQVSRFAKREVWLSAMVAIKYGFADKLE